MNCITLMGDLEHDFMHHDKRIYISTYFAENIVNGFNFIHKKIKRKKIVSHNILHNFYIIILLIYDDTYLLQGCTRAQKKEFIINSYFVNQEHTYIICWTDENIYFVKRFTIPSDLHNLFYILCFIFCVYALYILNAIFIPNINK